MTKSGYAKLADFGLAKLAEDSVGAVRVPRADATAAGMVIGTVPYMSPKQAAPDGQRFSMNTIPDAAMASVLTVVLNWQEAR
jgi:hypothetical protein